MPLSLQDRIEIEDLLKKYAYAIDIDSTEEDFLELFTEDAVFVSPVSGVHEDVGGLKKFLQRHVDHRGKELIRHFITNCLVEGDDDDAKIKAYFFEYKTNIEKPGSGVESRTEFLFCGNYDCAVRRVGGKWKISRRTVYVDHLSHSQGQA